MYCNNCGKELRENLNFCTTCGKKIKQIETESPTFRTGSSVAATVDNRIFDIISAILFSILAITYLITAFDTFEGNMDAFDWLSDKHKQLGVFFHWFICLSFILDCMQGIIGVVRKKQMSVYLCFVSLIVTTTILWIGSMIYNDFIFDEDTSILLYRLFGAYDQLTVSSYLLSIGALICSILSFKNTKR